MITLSPIEKQLCRVASEACFNVYEKNRSYGTNQFDHYITNICGREFQVVVIAGTNELEDNVRNINVFWSKKGIKIGSYNEAVEIRNKIKLFPHLPVIVTGHSKGGATAIAFFLLFCDERKDFCIIFAPARCLRYWRKRTMRNTIMFVDPDDAVSEWLGIINFGLPTCKTIEAPKDHLIFSITDHKMKNWKEFTKYL